jgi:uncharacterized protein (DUF2236 family)
MYHEDAQREPILPPREQWAELAVGPGSVTWERAADIRTSASAGTALLLQVAHPTVGAGVSDFSTFASDPWGRLWRTLDFVNVLVFAPPEAAGEMGARIRNFHKVIRGTKPDGTPYHALEPEAYAWVHMTLAESILRAHERFGRRFAPDELERFWREWRALGRFLGVRWRDMPETYAGLRRHVDFIVAERLERTAAVEEVYEALTSTPPPPSEQLGERAWGLLSRAPARFAGLATVALLPAELRARFGLELSREQRLELRAVAAAARRATPLMPGWLKNVGPGYLRWRRDPIARGEVASARANPHVAALMR